MASTDGVIQPPSGQPGVGAGDEERREERQRSAQLPETRPTEGETNADVMLRDASAPDRPSQRQEQEQEPRVPSQCQQQHMGVGSVVGEPSGCDPPSADGDLREQPQEESAGEVHTDEQKQEPQEQQRQGKVEGQQQQQPGEGQLEDAAKDASASAKDAEAFARAEALKREGNELFARGLWDEAAAKYNEALDVAPQSAAREQAIYFANLAACNIKTQQYAVAVQNCTEAIRLDGSYQKAYMRRSEAFERLDELDHALGDAKALLEVAPDSAWARARVAALQPRVDERLEKVKAEMFSKLKDLGNTVLGKFGMSLDNFKFDKDPNTGGYSVRFER